MEGLGRVQKKDQIRVGPDHYKYILMEDPGA